MRDREYWSIVKMIEYCDKAYKYSETYSFEEFIMDDRTLEATVFDLSQIGELVKNISSETMKKYPIRWRTLKGLRNRIVHDYEGINLVSIWKIIKEEILQLKIDLQEILQNEKKE